MILPIGRAEYTSLLCEYDDRKNFIIHRNKYDIIYSKEVVNMY